MTTASAFLPPSPQEIPFLYLCLYLYSHLDTTNSCKKSGKKGQSLGCVISCRSKACWHLDHLGLFSNAWDSQIKSVDVFSDGSVIETKYTIKFPDAVALALKFRKTTIFPVTFFVRPRRRKWSFCISLWFKSNGWTYLCYKLQKSII